MIHLKDKIKLIAIGALVITTLAGAGIMTQQTVKGGSSDFQVLPADSDAYGEPPLIPECELPVVPETPAFTTFKGTYTQSFSYDDRTFIRLENEEGGETDFLVTAESIVIVGQEAVSYQELSIGDVVTGYYVMPQIMTMIYPPQVQVTVLVKESEGLEGAYVDFFDENMLSSAKDLVLNINDSIPVVDSAGNLYTQSLENRVLVIFYSFKAMSYPAQTTPNKIIVLDVPTQLDQ